MLRCLHNTHRPKRKENFIEQLLKKQQDIWQDIIEKLKVKGWEI